MVCTIIYLKLGTISISITFFNKAVFAVYDFQASNFLTLGQMFFCIIFLYYLKKGKYVEFEDFNVETAKKVDFIHLIEGFSTITGLYEYGDIWLSCSQICKRTCLQVSLIFLSFKALYVVLLPSLWLWDNIWCWGKRYRRMNLILLIWWFLVFLNVGHNSQGLL